MKTIVNLATVRASGNRESWFKTITGIIEGGTGAKGVSGDYLKAGQNRLEVGTVVLHVWPSGSAKHQLNYADLLRVKEDGSLAEIAAGMNWKTEYPTIQDAAEKALTGDGKGGPDTDLAAMFAGIETTAMLAELERRGVNLRAVADHVEG